MAENNLGCGPLTVKYLVFLFNLVFFLSGLILIVVGAIAQGFFSSYMDFFGEKYETPAIGVIILGFVILVISFFGCCGAKKENVAMLRIFACLMIVVLLLEFAAAITVAILRPNIEELVTKNMNETMYHYNTTLVEKTWDDMQKNYKCCGTEDYTDWKDTPYGSDESVNGVPDSCCKKIEEGCGHNIWNASVSTNKIYTEGCFKAICDSARANLGAVIGGIIGLGLLQIIGIWMSCCLIRAVKERYEIL